MAVWGIWELESFFFSTGTASRKAHNLQRNPYCVVTTERAVEPVIVQGRAELVADREVLNGVYERYKAKYLMGYPADSSVYRVQPGVVFGLIEDAAEFAGAATRWDFTQ